MEDYFEWINSCRLIVSNDSFGLHLGLALRKKVLALFGSTNAKEVFFYGRGRGIFPDRVTCNKLPCYSSQCTEKVSCLSRISPQKVLTEIDRIFQEKRKDYSEVSDHSPGI